jgi:UDP-N-acetylglucosamine transferase subunit ALG13
LLLLALHPFLLIEGKSKEKLIIQDKSLSYKFKYKNVFQFSELSFPKLIRYLSEAKIIITHGAPSSIFLAQKYGINQPIIIPRNPKYKEHINNHQIIFSAQQLNNNYLRIITEENFKPKLRQYLQNPLEQKNKKQIICSPKLISNLEKFCQNLK